MEPEIINQTIDQDLALSTKPSNMLPAKVEFKKSETLVTIATAIGLFHSIGLVVSILFGWAFSSDGAEVFSVGQFAIVAPIIASLLIVFSKKSIFYKVGKFLLIAYGVLIIVLISIRLLDRSEQVATPTVNYR